MRYSTTQLSLLYIIMWIMPLSGPAQVQAQALIAAASQWHYYDKVTAPDKNWHKQSADNRSWQSGFAQFGYGEGDETTVTSFGKDSTHKPLSQYFVKTFIVSDITQIDALKLHLLADDGAIVYLNGHEVFRLHMPVNPAHSKQNPKQNLAANHALAASDSSIESIWIEAPLDKSSLKQGENFIAVEVHQIAADSSDLSFDLALIYTPLQVMPLSENIQPTQLTANQAVSLSMTEAKTFSQQYTIVLDEGVSELNINTSGGSGDADLYVGIDKPPTLSQYTDRSARPGNNETLTYQSPPAGTYYIRLYSYRAFANSQLKVQLFND